MCNVTAWCHSRLRAHWLMAPVEMGGGGWGRSMYSAFTGNYSVFYLSFVYGRSLWAELNGGENSLHWKANMLPLFSIMALCTQHTHVYIICIYILYTCTWNITIINFFLIVMNKMPYNGGLGEGRTLVNNYIYIYMSNRVCVCYMYNVLEKSWQLAI